jgi:VWA domain-containing protein
MNSWVRKRFEGIGLTQSPPGPHLAALQAKYTGTVLLCIDVSGSMSGEPLSQAVVGGRKFVDEALSARYDCGLVLWSDAVNAYLPAGTDRAQLTHQLAVASICGGTNPLPALELAKRDLAPLPNDRVLCIFSDGGWGHSQETVDAAHELCAMGVRIIVRGFGHVAADSLHTLLCPDSAPGEIAATLIEDVQDISGAIASMARSLTVRRPG